jgi:hypothetical protein
MVVERFRQRTKAKQKNEVLTAVDINDHTAQNTIQMYAKGALAEMEKWSLWVYRDRCGEEWDAQPACFLTDYFLALQYFCFAVYVTLWTTKEESNVAWYLIYFVAMGISALLGGLLHHVAFEALKAYAKEREECLLETAHVFGFHLRRSTIDCIIETSWRFVLCFSVVANFALLSLAASQYFSESLAYLIILCGATLYLGLAICASFKMHTIFLMIGYLPAMVFGAVTSVMAFEWSLWSQPSNELLFYCLKLSSALIQGLVVSPSNQRFNHNALSHVVMSLAATTMLIHFELE